MTSPHMLETTGITMAYAGVRAVDEVSVRLAAGEICGLIGPNGAGKTTLLNILSGYVRPLAGSVRLDGRTITGWPPHRRARAGIVRTFQATKVFPAFTVRENVQLAALGVGLKAGSVRERTGEVLELFGLQDLAERPAHTLPQGTERLVGLGRAVAAGPRFLLLDEPAAGLDDNESAKLGENLLRVREKYGMGIMLVEHDVDLVMETCERIHVLAMGRTIADGTPGDIARSPEVRTAYLGTTGTEPSLA